MFLQLSLILLPPCRILLLYTLSNIAKMATPKRVSYSIYPLYYITNLQNKFKLRFTDILYSPFIQAPALSVLYTINQSLYNDYEITVEVLKGFLDSIGKKVEF
jgi:hypothetical protein